jgi:hypothetical protein
VSRPIVVVPHVEGGLRPQTRAEVRRQWPAAHFALTPRRDPFSYADLWRRLWRVPADLVVVEQDVVPPQGAIAALLDCEHLWCSHPLWLGERYCATTWGLLRLTWSVRRPLPGLMDQLAAPLDPRYWVRRGWTRLDPDCSPAVLNSAGRRATLRPGAPASASSHDPAVRPTSRCTMGMDGDMARALQDAGVLQHIHQPPATHLHDYEANPPGSMLPWYQQDPRAQYWPAR